MKANIIFLVFLLSLLGLAKLHAQTPCQNGFAGIYPCNQVDLISHMDLTALGGSQVNDCWGWRDTLEGKDYAIIGRIAGTSFVDISDPANPVLIGELPTQNPNDLRVWRDIKVFNDHAFIVADVPSHGMQVFDLTQLRGVTSPPVQFDTTAYYDGFGRSHNMVINEETGYGYPVGIDATVPSNCQYGMHIINLNNPLSPTLEGCIRPASAPRYIHDAVCVVYRGPDGDHIGKELCFTFNDDRVNVVDVTNHSAPAFLITALPYPGINYCHQGWLTEDQRYLVLNDELDERSVGHKTRTHVFDMVDIDNPDYLGYHESATEYSIDHNLYIRDSLIFQANYRSGLRILDTAGISSPVAGVITFEELGYFDSFPDTSGSATNFEGSWSNYPFFESGLVIISDMQGGMFVVNPILDSIYIDSTSLALDTACSGGETTIYVGAHTATGNPVMYQWQVDTGSGWANLINGGRYNGVTTGQLIIDPVTDTLTNYAYRCILSAKNTRNDTAGTFALTLFPAPVAAFSNVYVNDTLFCTDQSQHASFWSWEFGDGNNSSDQNPVHRYAMDGNYTITLIVENNCGQRDTATDVVNILLDRPKGVDQYLQVFPNPAHGTLHFIPQGLSGELEIRMLSMTGKEVERITLQVTHGQSYLMEVAHLPPGIYVLDGRSGNTQVRVKVAIY